MSQPSLGGVDVACVSALRANVRSCAHRGCFSSVYKGPKSGASERLIVRLSEHHFVVGFPDGFRCSSHHFIPTHDAHLLLLNNACTLLGTSPKGVSETVPLI
jgi:hypothetical protein